MSILAWIVFGVVAGLLANMFVGGRRRGLLTDMLLGVVGAVVGGTVFGFFGRVGVTGFNLWSLFVAVPGAALVLVVHRALTRRRHARG